ncbi:MAG: diguanylate cyclase [Gammaproteobacteria bacterium]|nr:diguanylate cyclase [Gammaproteobacteria bacterium]
MAVSTEPMNDILSPFSKPDTADFKPLILIVDDSPTIRLSLSHALQDEFMPMEAVDGEQAWEFISSDSRIEVVITDLSMPRLDGLGLVKRMRDSVVMRVRNMPVIMVTGDDDAVAREASFMAGANDFVAKTSDRIELLARLRAHRKLAVTLRELEESQRELREQANTDPLTRLANRRFFSHIANKELSLMRRQKEYFAVLMMDIDHFKHTNDTFGHAAGDHVLVQVAQALLNNVREEDTLARVGGEEFVVSSPYTNRLAAIVLAERLRKAVESLEIQFEGNVIPVTISIGIAMQPQDGDSLDTLLAAADERLYIAKNAGRNRFCAASKHHDEQAVDVDMVCPKLDEAITMIRHGNLQRLMPHMPRLLEDLIPLFELANEKSPVHIDVDQVRETIIALKSRGGN